MLAPAGQARNTRGAVAQAERPIGHEQTCTSVSAVGDAAAAALGGVHRRIATAMPSVVQAAVLCSLSPSRQAERQPLQSRSRPRAQLLPDRIAPAGSSRIPASCRTGARGAVPYPPTGPPHRDISSQFDGAEHWCSWPLIVDADAPLPFPIARQFCGREAENVLFRAIDRPILVNGRPRCD